MVTALIIYLTMGIGEAIKIIFNIIIVKPCKWIGKATYYMFKYGIIFSIWCSKICAKLSIQLFKYIRNQVTLRTAK